MEREALRTLLKEIKESKYEVPEGINPFELSLTLMEYIGDIDGELRDQLVYYVLVNWILMDVLTPEEAHHIFMEAIDSKHLHNGLGEIGDKVFDRTYSVEVAACIIYKHRSFLSDEDILKAYDAILKFYNEDIDIRGYVKGKSWAHGAAHGADALMELSRCEIIGYEKLKELLDAVRKKINVNYYGYINNEDERMISVVVETMERNIIPLKEIEEWIRSFVNIEKTGDLHEDYLIGFNVSLFLKSLYFRLVDHPTYDSLTKVVKETLKVTNHFGRDYFY